jgi:hypothetical protein
MMKTLTAAAAVTLGLGFASAAFAAPPPLVNESTIAQIGVDSTAIVSQRGGNNNQGTFQVGGLNFAYTTQYGATSKGYNGANTDQVGFGNFATTTQSGGGYNNSTTAQFGFFNTAMTSQTSSSAVTNNSTTFQAGAFNHAMVTQH